jgi:hypothetical protein
MPIDRIAQNPFKSVGRNEPCPCGSGRKFKKCCLGRVSDDNVSLTSTLREPVAFDELKLNNADFDDLEFDDLADGITEYDPLVEPDPAEWCALDEQVRIDLVMVYHQQAGIELPEEAVHAIVHVIIENQIAEGEKLPVKRVAQRLMEEGLDRHDAIHAIGSVLAPHLFDLMKGETSTGFEFNASYYAELEHLTAEGWLRSG